MLKSKASLEKWAKEIVRCEMILENPSSSALEVQQAEWKIEAIMELYAEDFEATLMLAMYVEDLITKTFDK